LAKEIDVKEESVWAELEKIKLEERGIGFEKEEEISQKPREEVLEERILTLLLKLPEKTHLVDEESISFFSERGREILKVLISKKEISSPEIKEYFDVLSLRAEVEEIEQEKIVPEINFCLRELKLISLKKELEEVSKKIKEAEEKKDREAIKNLTEKISQISQKLSKL
jgi:hypothetical protein